MISLVGLLMMMVLAIGGVSAQFGQVFCGDLSEADCAILEQSQTAMMDLESSAFDLNMNFAMSGLPADAGMDSVEFGLQANGAFAADPAVMQAMEPTSPEDVAKMMAEMPTLLPELIRSLTGKMNMQITIPEAMKTPDMPELNFDLLVADGVMYFDAAPFMGAAEPTWMGVDLAAMFETMSSEMGDMSGMGDMSSIMELNMFTRFADPEYLKQFMTMTRLPDAEVMGQPIAVFEIVLDYGKLFGNAQFQADFAEYMQAIMAMQGASTEEMGEEFDTMMEMIYSMFTDSQMRMEYWVGQTDFYTHHMDMKLDFNMDFTAMAGMAGEDAPDNINITMNFVMDMSDFNQPVEVTIPENAQIINPAMMGMGSASS